MKNLKKKIGLIFMTFAMLCSIMPDFDIKLYASEYYTFNETLNEDQSEAVIELSIKQQIGKKVQKIELPDQSEAELTTDENGTTKTSYTAKENGKYDFKITYQEDKQVSSESSEPLSAEELEETLSYEVKDIKDIAIEEEKKEEETTTNEEKVIFKNEETQELGLAATGEYVAQAVDYSLNGGKGKVIAKFKTLQEALDYKKDSFYKVNLEILKDVIVDKTLLYPKYSYNTVGVNGQLPDFYAKITTAPTSNHSASGNPELYTGSSVDGRAILKRGPNNKGALIDQRKYNLDRSDGSGSVLITEGIISDLILDGGSQDGLSGDSLIISGSLSGKDTHGRLCCQNVKFMNNNNLTENGGAIRVLRENVGISDSEFINCSTKKNGGAIYSELASEGLDIYKVKISDCSADENGGGIAVMNNLDLSIKNAGHRVYFRYVKFVNNKAGGNGGAAYLSVSDLKLRKSAPEESFKGIEITKNKAGKLGAGLYVTTSTLKSNPSSSITIFTHYDNPGIPGTFYIFDNEDATTKGNLYMDDGVTLAVYGNLINDKFNNAIGLTLAGKDDNGIDRMEDGAELGIWLKNDDMNSKELQVIQRDSDINGYMYAGEGISNYGAGTGSIVWPKSPLKFTKVDEDDNIKTLANAEFILYQCNDSSHDHSKDPTTDLVKDSNCWQSIKTLTSSADGIIDFEELSSGQYMLVESKSPSGYIKTVGQWFIHVNNAPNVVRPQSYLDKVTITRRGTTLPPELTIKLDKDGFFESGQVTNTAGYTVTFDPMGGTMNESEKTQGVLSNQLLIRPTDPTRDPDTFLGWFKDKNLTDEWNFTTDRVTKDLTLYAKWKVSDASYFISIPKQITLEDGMDGYAQKKETISIVKDQTDSKWYPEEDILIKTATQITLTNPDNDDSYDVSVYDEKDSKYTDSNKELMALNVKDDTKQSSEFTLKTPISYTKMKNRYTGIMTFVIQFRP